MFFHSSSTLVPLLLRCSPSSSSRLCLLPSPKCVRVRAQARLAVALAAPVNPIQAAPRSRNNSHHFLLLLPSTLLPSALHARSQAASASDHAVPRELLGRRARHRPAGTDREPSSLVRRHSRVRRCSARPKAVTVTANRACGRRTTLGWSVPHRARWDSLTALIRVAFSQTVPKAVAKLGQMNCWSIGVVVCEHIASSPDLPTWHPLPILLTWCLWEQTSRTPSRWR